MAYSLETEVVHRVLNEHTGDSVEIAPESSGGDFTTIRIRSVRGEITKNITFANDQLPFIIEALQLREKELKNAELDTESVDHGAWPPGR